MPSVPFFGAFFRRYIEDMFYKTFLCSLVSAASAAAQPVIGGLILGAPLTDAIRINSVPAFAAVSADNGEFVRFVPFQA
jgi:hypothetical protein